MSQSIEWLDSNQIKVEPPKKPKKITGTRFATILGMSPWATPFQTWCEITKAYQEPFEDTKYTIFGKTVEPKQADFMEKYYMMNIIRPTEVYGPDPFKKTYGDFFSKEPIFGGMWDYLEVDEDRKISNVLEMKTSKRVEDWTAGPPVYYALQAALYAHLLGTENVVMVASFPEEDDYDHPEDFTPNGENTIIQQFNIYEMFPEFDSYIERAEDWWNKYVLTGISPPYDPKADKKYLDELKKEHMSVGEIEDLNSLLEQADVLKQKVDAKKAMIADDEKELKGIQEAIKAIAMEQVKPGTDKVVVESSNYTWTLHVGKSETINKDKLKEDGLWEKYTTVEPSYKFMATKKKGTKK